ncbi:regulatory protein RecX [Roseivirga sp.]|uniref:regulatory protein RecX n=1 Tax=Roseivirga sp. TaxID=1964215 RepID=UPI003B8B540D
MHNFQPRKSKKPLDIKSAKLKAADFCAYQERSQQEVRDKLYAYGLHEAEVEDIIVDLIVDGFINEERFAKAYAGGKFRVKGWGKRKIKQGLKQHRISEYCMNKGLAEIDSEEYYNTLLRHAEKKLPTVKGDSDYIIKGKLMQYLIGKGFEMDLIRDAVNDALLNRED